VNATTRRNDVNAIIGVVGVAQDVTEAAKHDRAVAAVSYFIKSLPFNSFLLSFYAFFR
jgi:hypothetical protein